MANGTENWTPEQSGKVAMKVRAVILAGTRLLVVPERRLGTHSHFTLPGGRVGRWETATDALVREVREETGLDVRIVRLLYVAEAMRRGARQDLNLIFLAEPIGDQDFGQLTFVDISERERPLVLPPILDEIASGAADGWTDTSRWLGNVWQELPSSLSR